MSFPETGALPMKEIRALLKLNDLIAAVHDWARESEGQLWAPSELTVANTIAVAEAITPRAGCPDMTPKENGAIVLDWSAADSWVTIEVQDDLLDLISASKDRQTIRRSGALSDLESFTAEVAKAL
ncbi:hypothetical protein B0I08_1032 [Glaciihabitans tibetensis]|uniref:Uncharacterized protein n=1 Tax=Glaciihabitans tibetensis TaxID=1266600 RepID=A0A2T0VF17_9MICO|nr:hypothetical protein [Glaciihabitans tibetensis]PRY68798.1 hypothetical protein B0I08_1032 [Glaciihabitans tibetensis]